MSASEKSSLKTPDIQKLGIIAGGGEIPARLLSACDQNKTDVFVVGFEGQTDETIMQGRHFMMTRLGAAGQIITTLKSHNIRDLVMIGSVRRPSLSELKPDMRTAKFFAKIGLRALGDDGLLRALRAELEQEGFIIHGVHSFMNNLLARAGAIGKLKPSKEDWNDIRRGIDASQLLGQLDIGQSIVIQQGHILGVEGAEGTNELVKRCGGLQRKGRGAVLVKTCKPQQDHDFDLPTIGPETIHVCAANGFSGIVVQAGNSLVVDSEKVSQLANEARLFVYAVDEQEMRNAA